MAYTPQTWADGSGGGTPITAARLTHMETGIADAHDPVPVVWSAELRITDTAARAEGLNGADLGVTVPAGLNLTRVQVRFGTEDASGQTDVQVYVDGDDTGMPLLSLAAPAVSQVWAGTVALTQGQALTAGITALGTTPGVGLTVLFSGTYA